MHDRLIALRTVPAGSHSLMPVPDPDGQPTLTMTGQGGPGGSASWQYGHTLLLRLVDISLVALALVLAMVTRFDSPGAAISGIPYAVVATVIGLVWLGCLEAHDAYDLRVLGAGAEEYKRVLTGTFTAFSLVAIGCYAARIDVARGFVALALPVGVVLLLAGRWFARRHLVRRRRAGAMVHRLLVVGDAGGAAEMSERFRTAPDAGYSVVGVVCEPDTLTPEAVAVSVVEAASRVRADAVAVAPTGPLTADGLREIAWALEGTGTDLLVAPSVTEVAGPRVSVRRVAGLPLLHLEEPELTGAKRVLKVAEDRVCAALGLLVLAPLLLGVALAIRLDTSGPALFVQRRVGIAGREFRVFKFRTMVVDAQARLAALSVRTDGDGLLSTTKDDPRITRVGRLLRRTSLDELPQLLNVLRGEMSLVGPRPPLPAEVAQYEQHVQRRLLVKPGMTGLWQVSGRSDLAWEDAVRLDLYYVENWSPALDLTILLRTATAVVRGSGAY
ncbi:MAG: sugar transferase [Actinomycetes bacterium]